MVVIGRPVTSRFVGVVAFQGVPGAALEDSELAGHGARGTSSRPR